MITLDLAGRKHYNKVRSKAKFTDKQYRTIRVLHEMKKVKLKDLSKELNISNSSLCIMLNKMVDEHYVAREHDERDRRDMYYYLTEKGERIFKDESSMRRDIMNQIFEEKLTEQEQDQFLEAVESLSEIFSKLAERS
ncbi:MAG: MarR family winged helix-turn-helix transcriptional regulator [Tissierellales bacterium]|nr:MarR family winged helix-turn-helix transcriptional regulator [Tissierellales bacterium]